MSDARDQGDSARCDLVARCVTLGLPVRGHAGEPWRFPAGAEPAQVWLRSERLTKMIDDALAVGSVDGGVYELFDDAWAVVLDGAYGAMEPLALAMTTRAAQSDVALEIGRAAGLESHETRRALQGLARFDRTEMRRLLHMLSWMRGDLAELSENGQAIGVFTDQLTDAYEQISLIYGLGKSMNRLSDPSLFLRDACWRLLGLLDFEWVAVHLLEGPVMVEVTGSFVVAGTPPWSSARLSDLIRGEINELAGDARSRILEPEHNELATRVGSQVLVHPILCGDELSGAVVCGNKVGADPDVSSIETQLLDSAADFFGSFLLNVGMYLEQRELFLGTVRSLTAAIDAKDQYTRGHSERVALLAAQLAEAMDFDRRMVDQVQLAGIVHDVGKIGVPEAVLRKPGKLTDAEYDLMKQHPVIGHHILKDIPPLKDILPGVLYHHERYDGTGYPEGLAGEDIPMLGRLLAVADAFDAMSSHRSYRKAMDRLRVLEEIRCGAGTQFDPVMAKAFLTLDFTVYDAHAEVGIERAA